MIVKSKNSQGEKHDQFEIVIGNLKDTYGIDFKELSENKHYLTISGKFVLRTKKGGATTFEDIELVNKGSSKTAQTYSFKKEVSATRGWGSQSAGIKVKITIKPDMDILMNLDMFASSKKSMSSAWADIDITSFDLKLYR